MTRNAESSAVRAEIAQANRAAADLRQFKIRRSLARLNASRLDGSLSVL
jgi:hypothetical protein